MTVLSQLTPVQILAIAIKHFGFTKHCFLQLLHTHLPVSLGQKHPLPLR